MMDRDPLALPGEPGYASGPDSDVEEVKEDDDVELEVELVPADSDYVKKLTGNRRGRKKKEVIEATKIGCINTGDINLNIQLIPSADEQQTESQEWDEDQESMERRGRKRTKPGRPRKKKKPVENIFKPNPASTHHSRESRYAQLQEKKDEFLQKQLERKAAIREKYKKHIDRAKEKYREKKASEEKKEKILYPFQKKLYRKITMLVTKIRHTDKSKSKDELVREMALEWKADRQQFWENYKKRWKEVAARSVKPMTEERAEFLRKRGQKYEKIKQEQQMMVNRVSTRNSLNKIENGNDAFDASLNSATEFFGESFDGMEEDPNLINNEFIDDEFIVEEESFQEWEHEAFVLDFNQGQNDIQHDDVDFDDPNMPIEYQIPNDMPAYFDDDDEVLLEPYQAEEPEFDQVNEVS